MSTPPTAYRGTRLSARDVDPGLVRVECAGEFAGSVVPSWYTSPDRGLLLVVSDGTVLRAARDDAGAFRIDARRMGSLFNQVVRGGDRGPDAAEFRDGVKWVEVASVWDSVGAEGAGGVA